VFFPEHRYYGKSKIPGAPAGNFDYLTSEQALADFAIFVGAMKEEYGMEKSPVIAFGGSYGFSRASFFCFFVLICFNMF
jgi:lysosomal Pro-X carboxypeptidase